MPDDPKKRGPADRKRIAIRQVFERNYWCKAFGITQGTLREACKAAGPMVVDVKKWLVEKIEDAE